MSLSGWDVADHLEGLLKSVGYTFHYGYDNTEEGHWFCWSNGKCDVETGDTCHEYPGAVMDAASHWFNNAKIPMENETEAA